MPYYKPYTYFNWGKKGHEGGYEFTDARQKALRKAQIASAMKRKGRAAASSVYKMRAAQLAREAERGTLATLLDWIKEGVGIGEVSADEWQFPC